MSNSQGRVTLQDAEARKILAQLPATVSEAVRKAAMRKALLPVRTALRSSWRGASTKHRGRHLAAIAAATQIEVKRFGRAGPDAVVRGKVGVVYGERGGKKAAGRQRLWHLLEGGFRHRSGRTVGGRHLSRTIAHRMLQAAVSEVGRGVAEALRKYLERKAARGGK